MIGTIEAIMEGGQMKGKYLLITCLLSVSVFFSISLLTALASDLDIPIVVKWEDGVPYDLDGPVEVYKDSVWVRDKSNAETKYVLIDEQYKVLEERKELERTDSGRREGERGTWFTVPEGGKAGTLAVSAVLPEELLGKDVIVTVSSNDGQGSLYLRQANGYEQTELVPAGTYRLFEAKVLGDVTQKYNPVYDAADLVISERGYGHLQIEFREGVGAAQDEETGKETEMEKVSPDQSFVSPATVVMAVIVGVIIISVIAFILLSVKMNME